MATGLLLVAATIPLLTWWRGHSLVWGLDSAFPLSLDDVPKYFHLYAGAYQQVDARKVSFIVPWGLLLEGLRAAGIGWNAGLAQRIFEVGLLAGSNLGARALVRLMFPFVSELSALLAALFYSFNLFALTTVWTSQALLIVHYSCLPIFAFVVLKGIRARRWLASGLVAIAWTLLLGPAYITTPLALTDVLLVATLSAFALWSWQLRLRRVVLSLAQVALFWIGLNAYWLVPLVVNYRVTFAEGIASISGTTSAELFRLNSASWADVLRLGGYWGLHSSAFGSPYYPWAGSDTKWTHAIGYVPVVLVGVGLYGVRTPGNVGADRHSLLLGRAAYGAALVLFLFLATGGHAPFGLLKFRLFADTGLINSFRSVYQRFTEYLPILMAPFFALGLDLLWSTAKAFRRRSSATLARAALVGAPLAFLVTVPWPLWDGALFDGSGAFPANRVTVPSAWFAAARSIPITGVSSALVLPIGTSNVTYLDWSGARNGYIGIHPLSNLTSSPVLDQAPTGSWLRTQIQVGLTSPSAFCSAVTRLDVGVVVWAGDADFPLMQAAQTYLGADAGVVARILRPAPCLTLLRTSADVDVYRVTAPQAGLVAYADAANGPTRPASSRVSSDFSAITTVRRDHKYLVLDIPYAGDWRLQGRGPVAQNARVTVFRVPPTGALTVVDPTQARMRSLLVLSALETAIIAIAALLTSRLPSLRARLWGRRP